jgi:Raf kinase inhibitor-like YbhB/YbcL family protein
MIISSSHFDDGEFIPKRFSCDGDNIPPDLEFMDIPNRTQTLVLIIEDPDAPSGIWSHWVVWNIDPRVDHISDGIIPPGAREGANSSGSLGYQGPCPPNGLHRYIFRLFALDGVLTLPPDSGREDLLEAISGHIIEAAKLVGLYERK